VNLALSIDERLVEQARQVAQSMGSSLGEGMKYDGWPGGEPGSMTQMSIAEAQRNLADLVERVVQEGEIVLLLDKGKPVAKLVSAGLEEPGRHLANVQGWLDDDDPFFSAIEEIAEARGRHLPRVTSARDAR
jgi:prevent-host-death family protein